MEAQTGRYRLGLASNLPAKQGCLEEMTPFQTLNYNKKPVCTAKHTLLFFNTPKQAAVKALIVISVKSDTCGTCSTCVHF